MDEGEPYDMLTICVVENGDMVEMGFKACPSIRPFVISLLVETIIKLEFRCLS